MVIPSFVGIQRRLRNNWPGNGFASQVVRNIYFSLKNVSWQSRSEQKFLGLFWVFICRIFPMAVFNQDPDATNIV